LGKGPLGRPKPRWEDKLKIDHKKGTWTGLGGPSSGQGQVVGCCEHNMKFSVPYSVQNFLIS
jgi:hypothetical protein